MVKMENFMLCVFYINKNIRKRKEANNPFGLPLVTQFPNILNLDLAIEAFQAYVCESKIACDS